MRFLTVEELNARQRRQERLLHLALGCVVLLAVIALASCGPVSDAEIESGVAVSGDPAADEQIEPVRVPPAERLITTTTVAPTTTHFHPPTTVADVPVRTAAASAPVVVASAVGPCGGWEDTVRQHFGDETAKACDVIRCETGGTFDPTIENPNSTASGLAQFLDSTWAKARAIVGAEQYARASHAPGAVQIAAMAAWKRATSWGQWVCG